MPPEEGTCQTVGWATPRVGRGRPDRPGCKTGQTGCRPGVGWATPRVGRGCATRVAEWPQSRGGFSPTLPCQTGPNRWQSEGLREAIGEGLEEALRIQMGYGKRGSTMGFGEGLKEERGSTVLVRVESRHCRDLVSQRDHSPLLSRGP